MRVDKEFKLFCFGIGVLIAKYIILREFKKSTNIDLNDMWEKAAKN